MEPKWIGCPESNFRRGRPFGLRPEAIVIHIMDGTFAAGESVFRNPKTQKSAHYGISNDGEVHQYVNEDDTAFHAGIVVNPTWALLKPKINPNFYTVGIEHEGRPDDVWPDTQLSASALLLKEITERWKIPLDGAHVIRHHQIRASKTCPGNWLHIGELLKRAAGVRPATLAAVATQGTVSTIASPVFSPEQEIVPPAPTVPLTPIAPPSPTIVSGPETKAGPRTLIVRTVKNVNLRRAKPATSAHVVRVIPAHSDVAVSKFEFGERVDGNPYWYVDVEGNYLWAGATDTPNPTTVAA
jgi:N-acetylmuramoyl-L-alanine amidase